MFNGYDYVWMGHVHKPQIMKKSNPYIAHIGSMDISNFGETDHNKSIVVFDCSSQDNNFKLVNIPTRALKKINVIVPKDTTDPTQYIVDVIKNDKFNYNKCIVKVEITLPPDSDSVNKFKIEKSLVELGVFNIAGISQSKKVSVVKRDVGNTIDTKMDFSAAIKTYSEKYISEEKRGSFMTLATDIYKKYKDLEK